MTVKIEEGPLDSIGSIAKGIGSKIKNSTLASLGNDKAKGALELNNATENVMSAFQQYLGRNSNAQPTFSILQDFVAKRYGNEYAGFITKAAKSLKVVDPAEVAKINGLKDASKQRYADQQAAKSKSSENSIKYQNSTMAEIIKSLKQPTPNNNQIMSLTKELIAYAKDHQGPDKDRIKLFLQQAKKQPSVVNNQQLAQFMSGIQLENVNKAFDLAIFLVENSEKSRAILSESVGRYLLEGIMAIREEAILKRSQIEQIFKVLAQTMLNNKSSPSTSTDYQEEDGGGGGENIQQEPKKSAMDHFKRGVNAAYDPSKSWFNKYQGRNNVRDWAANNSNNKQDDGSGYGNGGYSPKSKASLDSSIASMRIDPAKLSFALKKNNVDHDLAREMEYLASSGASVSDIAKKFKGKSISGEALMALAQAINK